MTDQTAAAKASEAKPASRTPAQIEADIASTRADLADRLDVLENKVRPANLIAAAKQRALGLVTLPDGSPDPKKAAIAGAVVLVFVVYLVRRRRL